MEWERQKKVLPRQAEKDIVYVLFMIEAIHFAYLSRLLGIGVSTFCVVSDKGC